MFLHVPVNMSEFEVQTCSCVALPRRSRCGHHRTHRNHRLSHGAFVNYRSEGLTSFNPQLQFATG
jgi:hypothetical protein